MTVSCNAFSLYWFIRSRSLRLHPSIIIIRQILPFHSVSHFGLSVSVDVASLSMSSSSCFHSVFDRRKIFYSQQSRFSPTSLAFFRCCAPLRFVRVQHTRKSLCCHLPATHQHTLSKKLLLALAALRSADLSSSCIRMTTTTTTTKRNQGDDDGRDQAEWTSSNLFPVCVSGFCYCYCCWLIPFRGEQDTGK